ncbi:MAG: VCBS repeat-containing protein [Sandaracinaceae bacterium]|nr:VCBS repeat-containing protein [Sandaracinaceae bacterium]
MIPFSGPAQADLPPGYVIALGDVDGDGDLDLLLHGWESGLPGNLPTGVTTLLSWDAQAGRYEPSAFPSGEDEGIEAEAEWAQFGDVDGDGDLDLVTDDRFRPVWINDGTGVFSAVVDSALAGPDDGPSVVRARAMSDLDDDGDLDVVYVGSGPGHVWLNDGAGHFTDSGQALSGDRGQSVALGDVDGDGDTDMLVFNFASRSGQGAEPDRVWLNDGTGHFDDSGQRLSGSVLSTHGALGDVDGDGDLDAVVGGFGGGLVWLNDGAGTFRDSGQRLDILDARALSLGDLDGDGDIDVFMTGFGEGVRLWANDSRGRFISVDGIPDAWEQFGVGAQADIDGDGIADLILAFYHHTELWLGGE